MYCFQIQSMSIQLNIPLLFFFLLIGSDYGYAWPDAIQIKRSAFVIQTARISWPMHYVSQLLCQWFSVWLSPCQLYFF